MGANLCAWDYPSGWPRHLDGAGEQAGSLLCQVAKAGIPEKELSLL
jgi:hypothetical protein